MASCRTKRDDNINVKTTKSRHDKLKDYAASKDTTVTALVEKWIDELELPKYAVERELVSIK